MAPSSSTTAVVRVLSRRASGAAFLECSHRGKAVSDTRNASAPAVLSSNGVDLGTGEDRAGGVERRGFVRVQLAHGGPSSRCGAGHCVLSENYALT